MSAPNIFFKIIGGQGSPAPDMVNGIGGTDGSVVWQHNQGINTANAVLKIHQVMDKGKVCLPVLITPSYANFYDANQCNIGFDFDVSDYDQYLLTLSWT